VRAEMLRRIGLADLLVPRDLPALATGSMTESRKREFVGAGE